MDVTEHNKTIEETITKTECFKNAKIYSNTAQRLGEYNTLRGGKNGYCGFVFEELHAADASTKGINIKVIGNNGVADFVVTDTSGNTHFGQAKAGYRSNPNAVNWSKYEGQTIIVDKGNNILAEKAIAAGHTVEESSVSKAQADIIAKAQQFESHIAKTSNAPISATAFSAHNAGKASANLVARVGVPMKIGENIYDLATGEITFEEAATNVVVDSAKLVGGAYVGTAALTVAGTAATVTAEALATTTVGAAVATSLTTAGTVVAGTAVGSAMVAGATTVAGIAATTAGAIASAPLAPVIAVGIGLGLAKKIVFG